MMVEMIRLLNVRCFEDTGNIYLSPSCNVFVGQNNAGKSTILKGVLSLQNLGLQESDGRPGDQESFVDIVVAGLSASQPILFNTGGLPDEKLRTRRVLSNQRSSLPMAPQGVFMQGPGLFNNVRPFHGIVPFISRRMAAQFDHNVSLGAQVSVSGTLHNLYSRIDLVATAGHPKHESFQSALRQIVGLPITTKASSNGKEAGFYYDIDNFVPLDRMGDGIIELVALIVELCLETGKIFVLEEPETNLHPGALKALLSMVRESAEHNQFVIATHSNIVVRELGSSEVTKIFRVARQDDGPTSPSTIEELPRTTDAHRELLRELGYEFGDLGLHDGWLFLEESSAESVIREILIPKFLPGLVGRMRTYSARGAANLEPSVSEFVRLITFVHLEPAYRGRLWVRADGDLAGQDAARKVREKFPYLDESVCGVFSQSDFEYYYPGRFQDQVSAALSLTDKRSRQSAKLDLLKEVLSWSHDGEDCVSAWEESAGEVLALLRTIYDEIATAQ